MRIAVVGAGAMGSLYGGMLSKNNQVYLVDIWQEHVDAINKSGLVIENSGSTSTYNPTATTNPAMVGEVDLVILFVKSTQTLSALESNKVLIGEDTFLLSLQNGYGNTDDMLEFVPPQRVLAGTTGHGCTMKEPGVIFHAGEGDTYIGSIGEDQTKAAEIAEILKDAGFKTSVSSNILSLIWSKLFVNAGINAITALLDFTNNNIAENEFAKELADKVVREAVAIANHSGMVFDPDTVAENVFQVAIRTGANRSSMLADVTNKRQTEILKINGAIVKKARECGLEAPYNLALTNLILAKENTY